jgi:hypothetical protein
MAHCGEHLQIQISFQQPNCLFHYNSHSTSPIKGSLIDDLFFDPNEEPGLFPVSKAMEDDLGWSTLSAL